MLIFTLTALLFYGVAFARILLSARAGTQLLRTWQNSLLVGLGIVSELFAIGTDGAPLALDFYSAATLFALAMSIVVLLGSIWRPVFNLFLFLLPVNILCLLLSFVIERSPLSASLNDYSTGMLSHIVLSVLAYSFVTIASAQALLLAWQHKQLKEKKVSKLASYLPPIQTIEAIMFDLILIGELLLTLSIVSGLIFIDDIFEQHLVHKTVFSLVSWAIFALLLAGRQLFGWRGKQAVSWCLWGFFCLMLAYFGTKFVLELVLHRN